MAAASVMEDQLPGSHVAHLSYANPSIGQHHFRAFCSCGFDSGSSDRFDPALSRLLEHTEAEVEMSCGCWSTAPKAAA